VLGQTSAAVTVAFHSQQEVRVRLSPPELGDLEVNVSRREEGSVARIESHTAATHQLLLEHLPSLRESLAQSGIPVHEIEVAFRQPSPEGQPFGFAGNSFQQQQGQAPPRNPMFPEFEPAPGPRPFRPAAGGNAEPTVRGPHKLRQIDIQI
jgi:flagellar hook-length control protein FliK